MKKYLVLGGVMTSVLFGLSVKYPTEINEMKANYILQGATQQTIIEDVEKVGGEVTFSHSIIQAVSVKLTESQVQSLKSDNPMLRFFEDQEVKVSGKKSKNKSVVSSTVSETTTSDNYVLFDIKPLEETINTASSLFLNFILGAASQTAVTVEDETMSLTSWLLSDSTKARQTIDSVEKTLGYFGIDVDIRSMFGLFKTFLDSNEANWVMTNNATTEKQISKLTVRFPVENGFIASVTINDVVQDFIVGDNNELQLSTPIALKVGENADIRIGFDTLASVSLDHYSLSVGYSDGSLENILVANQNTMQGANRDTYFAKAVNANLAHELGITGSGVTVAILDTGLSDMTDINANTGGWTRNITFADITNSNDVVTTSRNFSDGNGHGTHLASIIANSSRSYDENGFPNGGYNGVAPDANLFVVKAFDEQGHSSYLDILKSIDYIYENKDKHNIKILNLSFSALPSSLYWDDPLNQALMKLWDEGITVVASAGNTGADAMTIGVPGNIPYVITVGAVSDNYTPDNLNDDFVTSFSSAGPTYEGFVKPEIVAPGARIQGLISEDSYIRQQYAIYSEENAYEHDYFELSGTSQSTAVTSGIIALMLQVDPDLSPDDIKCRLMVTARVATNESGNLAYSVFQQGAGLVDAMAAIDSSASNCANVGLSVKNDLSGDDHYMGPVQQTEVDGEFIIPGAEELSWSGEYVYAHTWSNSEVDTDSQLWRNMSFQSDAKLWNYTTFGSNSQLWRNMSFQSDSQLWRNMSFQSDSQLWRDMSFQSNSQLWRDMTFENNSQLWRNMSFQSNSVETKWVDHE